MHVKIKALLHAFAAVIIFFLTDSFCGQIIRMAVMICSSAIILTALYTCLDILNVGIAVTLYAKYVLRRPLSELCLGKPYPALRWCIMAVIMPLAADVIYFICTKGKLEMGCFTQDELAYMLFHEVFSSGLRVAVTEGVLFWGLLFSTMQKGFGKKWGVVTAGFFYAAACFIYDNSFPLSLFSVSAKDFGIFLSTFLMGMAFVLVTCETGSVWSSVAIQFLYNAFSGDAYILHIGTSQDFPAIYTYTVENGGILFTSLPLPSMIVFVALIMLAVRMIKKKDGPRAGI